MDSDTVQALAQAMAQALAQILPPNGVQHTPVAGRSAGGGANRLPPPGAEDSSMHGDSEVDDQPEWEQFLSTGKSSCNTEDGQKLQHMLTTAPPLSQLKKSQGEIEKFSDVPETPPSRANRIDKQLYLPGDDEGSREGGDRRPDNNMACSNTLPVGRFALTVRSRCAYGSGGVGFPRTSMPAAGK